MMSVVQMCFFWCSGLFYCVLDLVLKSLNKPLDPLVYCYSLTIFSQVGVATKLWNMGVLIVFSKCQGIVGAPYLQKSLLQSPLPLESQLVKAGELEPDSMQRYSLLQKC